MKTKLDLGELPADRSGDSLSKKDEAAAKSNSDAATEGAAPKKHLTRLVFGLGFLSVVAVLVFCILGLVGVVKTAADNEPGAAGRLLAGTLSVPDRQVSTSAELIAAYDEAPAATPFVIELTADIVLTDMLIIGSQKDITLTGSHRLIAEHNDRVITVQSKLTIDGVTITHAGGYDGRGVYLQDRAQLTMLSGLITGNNQGAVFYTGGSVFIMEGGEISGNSASFFSGGGVHLGSGATSDSVFIMNGGVITNNTASNGGAGVHNNYGTFTMNGGVITGNTVSDSYYGGGVLNEGGTFTMTGGEISNNVASTGAGGGIANYYATLILAPAAGKSIVITGNRAQYAGGIFSSGGTVTMRNGIISGNTASATGGGIYNSSGNIFTMENGQISNNSAGNAGGVYNSNGGTFDMENGTISSNTATANGGGVYNNGGTSTFAMENGEINNNSAANGGGILNANSGTINLQAGDVRNNIASVNGGGVYTNDYTKLNISAGLTFSGNSAAQAYDRDRSDPSDATEAAYLAHVHCTAWTTPFTQGYNNYDINYTEGEKVTHYTVSFDSNGGSEVASIAGLTKGATITAPSVPIKAGSTFAGWYKDVSLQIPWDFAINTVEDNITLYAKWIPNQTYTVIYEPGAHGTFVAQAIDGLHYGSPTPAAPVVTGRDGWHFIGWHPARSTVVKGNATYIAQWLQDGAQPSVYTVTFVDWDGSVLKTDQVTAGENATPPDDPIREGYIFVGWDFDFTEVAEDITVTAQYDYAPEQIEDDSEIPPLAKPTDTTDDQSPSQTWALMNLILSIAGVIVAGVAIIAMLRTDQDKMANRAWLIATLALGIIGILVFLLTQDISKSMALVDIWTIVSATIIVMEIVSAALSARKPKKNHR